MAVAPVAAAMGPRNKRRLATLTITIAAVGSIAVLLLLLFNRPPDHASLARSDRAAPPGAATARLIFGMTRAQVQRLTGPPAKARGNCWLFHPTREGMVGSISVQPSFAKIAYNAQTTGNLRLCFAGGAFSYGFLRIFDKQNQKWVWGAWPLELSPAR